MKEKQRIINILNLSHPLMTTEWLSILGDKFCKTLPFEWTVTRNFEEAQIVLWDGIITPKNHNIITLMLPSFKTEKVLLLVGESITLFNQHPIVKLCDVTGLQCVELGGWNILPEEILSALEECYGKLKHV